jgi:hypothetical protein
VDVRLLRHVRDVSEPRKVDPLRLSGSTEQPVEPPDGLSVTPHELRQGDLAAHRHCASLWLEEWLRLGRS